MKPQTDLGLRQKPPLWSVVYWIAFPEFVKSKFSITIQYDMNKTIMWTIPGKLG